MGTYRFYIPEPRQRRDREITANIMDIIEQTGADVQAERVRPVDTPAVSPWTGVPESFAELEQPTRVHAATMAPQYQSLGVSPGARAAEMAGWRTQAVASLPRDPAAKIGVFARARFPELPMADATARYGAMGERIFYIDRDGTPKWEEPSFWTAFDDPRRVAAAMAGPNMAIAGAGIGGVVGGVAGAAGGAAVGDVARQYLAARLADERMSLSERAFQTGMEALAGAGGRYVGDHAISQLGPVISTSLSIPAQVAIRKGANEGAFWLSRSFEDLAGSPVDRKEGLGVWHGAP